MDKEWRNFISPNLFLNILAIFRIVALFFYFFFTNKCYHTKLPFNPYISGLKCYIHLSFYHKEIIIKHYCKFWYLTEQRTNSNTFSPAFNELINHIAITNKGWYIVTFSQTSEDEYGWSSWNWMQLLGH